MALQSVVLGLVAGLQSLLLLIFAVTVQNLFLHMLALPDTIGEMIKRRNRIAWFIALLLASYVYLQTLLNPNGDLAHSLETSNVRAFIGTIGLFLLFVVITSTLLRRLKPVEAGETTSMPRAEENIPPQTNASPAAWRPIGSSTAAGRERFAAFVIGLAVIKSMAPHGLRVTNHWG